MVKSKFFLAAVTLMSAHGLLASEAPQGNLLELHSCELYAGGCVVSSESTTGGHYMLRAWQFTGGNYAGASLDGLCVAALQSAPSENLAASGSPSGDAVVYLPEHATTVQRDALLAWVKTSVKDFHPARIETRTAPLSFSKKDAACSFAVGDSIKVETAPQETCETGACGEALWYTPRSSTSVFAVEVARAARVVEPLLKLKWTDAGKRSVFLARFGDSVAQDQFVTTAELCAPNGRIF